MEQLFFPEGRLLATAENRELTATPDGLQKACAEQKIVEGIATLCDGTLRLHIDLGCMEGIMEPDEVMFTRAGETRKDIGIITRVGKPVAARVLSIDTENGVPIARLSRRLAQIDCTRAYLSHLTPGDLIPATVTHLEPFGAFLDVGCGIPTLLSVDCISVSRISHPRDRLSVGMPLTVAVKSMDPDSGRIYVTLRELLGTWEENAARFTPGETVTGIVRSVEPYGIFVELTPNLAGLAELRPEENSERLKAIVGKGAAVYIKSIMPDRMKIKLVLINAGFPPPERQPLTYFIDPISTPHLSSWVYSPPGSRKLVETQFDGPI